MLRVSKIDQTWRWFLEDWDVHPIDALMDASAIDFPTWEEAEAAATTAHPGVDLIRNVVRGKGTEYADSLPMIPWP